MKRIFIPGEEWLYYKIYCGNRTADLILTEAIKPLTEKLLKNNSIDKWFFIRYSDPKPHLRIRFHYTKSKELGNIIFNVKDTLKPFAENNLIWKIQIGSYEREVERYGEHTIINAEDLFFIDSVYCLNILSNIDDDEVLFLLMLKLIDDLLTSFSFSVETKQSFTKRQLNAYKREFNSDKDLVKQLGVNYNNSKEKIVSLLLEQDNSMKGVYQLLKNKKNEIEGIANTIVELNKKNKNLDIESLLSSYIHMMVNRFFRDKQRLYELVCYDCIHKFYNYLIATKR
ncbi:thiopeptide-type bacteriocin biosynthesis protein [Tenacibaculum sp. 190524A02b]|uniref:thiopeptide-type bacteriocin biosynthesis protein n=1 Tax=Tenacibaculum vairaonense TaxID=3137860 RepID=UPI0031FAA9B5